MPSRGYVEAYRLSIGYISDIGDVCVGVPVEPPDIIVNHDRPYLIGTHSGSQGYNACFQSWARVDFRVLHSMAFLLSNNNIKLFSNGFGEVYYSSSLNVPLFVA